MKLFLFLTCWTLCYAGIHEIPHFHQLANHVDEDTIVLLDIDDTLLVPAQMLGSESWLYHRLNLRQQNGTDFQKAFDESIAEWEAVRHFTEMVLVETGTDEVIQNLQNQNICLMGLTAQQKTLSSKTPSHLLSNGIDLTPTAPADSEHLFQGVLFRKGVLFTSGINKGKSFFRFCEVIGLHPKKIVLVDDKASHLIDFEKTAMERGVEFIGLRYSYSDAIKREFRPDVAEYQFTHSTLSEILSDEEALRRMESE